MAGHILHALLPLASIPLAYLLIEVTVYFGLPHLKDTSP